MEGVALYRVRKAKSPQETIRGVAMASEGSSTMFEAQQSGEQQTEPATWYGSAIQDSAVASNWRSVTYLLPTASLTMTGYRRSWMIPMSIEFVH